MKLAKRLHKRTAAFTLAAMTPQSLKKLAIPVALALTATGITVGAANAHANLSGNTVNLGRLSEFNLSSRNTYPEPTPGSTQTNNDSPLLSQALGQEYVLVHRSANIPRLNWVGGGDADVVSKKGRMTQVDVVTRDIQLERTYLNLTVQYDVREMRKDYTHLSKSETFRLPAPDGFCITGLSPRSRHAQFREVFVGKDHSFHDVTHRVPNSYFSSLVIRFDGKGRDDTGNAQLRGTLAVPVYLESCNTHQEGLR